MKCRRGGAIASVTLLAAVLIQIAIVPSTVAQSDSLMLSSTSYYVVQGESSFFEGNESANDISFLKIVTFDLPYNVTRVYTAAPPDALDLTIWAASSVLQNTSYGWETSGPMAGSLFVDVPSWFDRNDTFSNFTDTQQSILAPESVLAGVVYDSGALHLEAGATQGSYVSARIAVPECVNIVSANLTLNGSDLQSISPEISNDNGTTWATSPLGINTNLITTGSSLRVRLGFSGSEASPLVTGLKVTIRYTPISIPFTMHMTYLWSGQFEHGELELDLTEPVPYLTGSSSFVFLYVLDGYSVEGTGFELILDENGDPREPGKMFYVNMSLSMTGRVARSIVIHEPATNWAFLGALALVIGAVCVGGYILWKRRVSGADATEDVVLDESAVPSRSEDLATRRAELLQRKKEIARRVDEIEAAVASGNMTRDDVAEEADALKKESKKIRNELNRISRKVTSAVPSPEPSSSPDQYESILASMARLDEDFEKGRLPEKSYRSMRKEYASKAAQILAQRATAEASDDPLEREKAKLIEAIVALEDEHESGKVDTAVYAELRASYRKELAALLREINEAKED